MNADFTSTRIHFGGNVDLHFEVRIVGNQVQLACILSKGPLGVTESWHTYYDTLDCDESKRLRKLLMERIPE